MADDKKARDKQARDADRRQRERDIAAAVDRADEPEPPTEPVDLDDLEAELASLDFPATAAEVVAAVGDHEVDSAEGTDTVEELIPDADVETFDSPADVRARVRRPTVAAAMKRIVEASETLQNAEFRGSQRDAYVKTLRELAAIDADDDEEGVRAIADWIVERIHEDERLPGSRAVRREAARFCRANGYPIRNDDWLGI